MNFTVKKVTLSGSVIEDYGVMSEAELKTFGEGFIPALFESKTELNQEIKAIKVNKCADWAIAPGEMIFIREYIENPED